MLIASGRGPSIPVTVYPNSKNPVAGILEFLDYQLQPESGEAGDENPGFQKTQVRIGSEVFAPEASHELAINGLRPDDPVLNRYLAKIAAAKLAFSLGDQVVLKSEYSQVMKATLSEAPLLPVVSWREESEKIKIGEHFSSVSHTLIPFGSSSPVALFFHLGPLRWILGLNGSVGVETLKSFVHALSFLLHREETSVTSMHAFSPSGGSAGTESLVK